MARRRPKSLPILMYALSSAFRLEVFAAVKLESGELWKTTRMTELEAAGFPPSGKTSARDDSENKQPVAHAWTNLELKALSWGSDAVTKFSSKQCIAAIRILSSCLKGLSWQILDPSDIGKLTQRMESMTSDDFRRFFAGLSTEAQRHERVACTLGWMARMMAIVKSRSKLAVSIEIELELHAQAGCNELADHWPEQYRNRLKDVSAADVEQFHEELCAFTNQ
ncbi:hypothetical protein B0H12DRAFT_1243627 [Mycena haematopus]|nr:hypothetical protein B0H12DRAFT_1243627 [Mycena haematopus]